MTTRAVARVGPRMNTSSSSAASSANAVGSNVEPASNRLHRARAQLPTGGRQAPASTAAANQVGRGASDHTAVSSAATPSRCPQTPSTRMRACPYRSRARPITGAHIASAIAPQAATPPPTAYDPVRFWTNSTVPIVCIARGSRPTKAAGRNLRAPGVASVRRYREGVRPPASPRSPSGPPAGGPVTAWPGVEGDPGGQLMTGSACLTHSGDASEISAGHPLSGTWPRPAVAVRPRRVTVTPGEAVRSRVDAERSATGGRSRRVRCRESSDVAEQVGRLPVRPRAAAG